MPRDDRQVSEFFRWLTVTHTQRWHAHHAAARITPGTAEVGAELLAADDYLGN